MTTSLSLAVQTLALMTMIFAPADAQPQPAKPSFSMTISAPETVVKAGSMVRVSLALKNESGERIFIVRDLALGYAEEYTDLEVRDEKGNAVPEGRYYAVLKGKPDPGAPTPPGSKPIFAPIFVGGSHTRQWVSPGDTWKDEINVSNLLNMTRPGKYTILVSRPDPASGVVVKSNTITVTVTE